MLSCTNGYRERNWVIEWQGAGLAGLTVMLGIFPANKSSEVYID
jgi:hypothetical protein